MKYIDQNKESQVIINMSPSHNLLTSYLGVPKKGAFKKMMDFQIWIQRRKQGWVIFETIS